MALELTTSNITWNGILHIGITVPDYNAAWKRLKDTRSSSEGSWDDLRFMGYMRTWPYQ